MAMLNSNWQNQTDHWIFCRLHLIINWTKLTDWKHLPKLTTFPDAEETYLITDNSFLTTHREHKHVMLWYITADKLMYVLVINVNIGWTTTKLFKNQSLHTTVSALDDSILSMHVLEYSSPASTTHSPFTVQTLTVTQLHTQTTMNTHNHTLHSHTSHDHPITLQHQQLHCLICCQRDHDTLLQWLQQKKAKKNIQML